MFDVTLLAGLALAAGAIAAQRPAPTVVACVVAAACLRRRLRPAAVVVAVALFGWAALRARRQIDAYERSREVARVAIGAPSRCDGVAVVVSSPVRMHGALRWDARFDQLRCDERDQPTPLAARLYGGPDELARGARVEVVAQLAAVQPLANEELDDPRPTAARMGHVLSGGVLDARVVAAGSDLASRIDRLRAHVRGRIDATFAPAAAPLARALVLGETDLDAADDEAFRTSGLSHLLAVSGTHLALVVVSAVAALGAILVRVERVAAAIDARRIASAAGVALAWAYADFAGGSGSARRAAAMLTVALAARALGRHPRAARSFGLSTVALALVDPLAPFDVSLVLSAAATAGLLVLGPLLARAVEPRVPALARPVARAVSTTLAATLPCAPLLVSLGPTLPVGGVVANVLAVPLGELFALPLALTHVMLSPWPAAERGAAAAAGGALLAVRAIAVATASVRALAPEVPRPTAWQLACLVAGAAAIAAASGRRRKSVAAAAVAALLVAGEARVRADGAPRGRLRVSVLDVGQGDSTLVDLPDGSAMLIDGGGMVGSPVDPGRAVVLPVLRARRRAAVALAVLSHPHPDHFLGLASALPALKVGAFWDTGQGEREGAGPVYAELLRGLRARGVAVVRPDALCGGERALGGARVEVLAPCPEPVALGGANDNSLVVRVRLGRRAALLVGDAEHGAEERLVATYGRALAADLLKVGHHGSRTSSSPPFLAAVAPRDAVISCGVRNRFGHPHPFALAALAGAGVRVHRTDLEGSVRWETDGERVQLVTARGGVVDDRPAR